MSASQVQVSIFLPHYADDVLCKFLMELLSTSDLIFTQGAKQSKDLFITVRSVDRTPGTDAMSSLI